MAQDYDKIFRQNIEEIILPLAIKLLHIQPERLEEIPDDLQTTIERKPDFLKRVRQTNPQDDYILQLEFQKEDDPKMLFRMLEYGSILIHKYEIPIKQFVFFIGTGKAQMPTTLHHENLQFQFSLINLQDFEYTIFLEANTPEEVILAILGNFGNDNPQKVVQALLNKLKNLPIETLRREKCVKQLEVLSMLRNLQEEIIKQLSLMPLDYDIEKDLRFKQGIEKGIEKGKIEQSVLVIQRMHQRKISTEQIADFLGLSLDFVKQVIQEMKS